MARKCRLLANQWGLLFLDHVVPESPLYHVMWTCPVTGQLDADLLRRALRAVTVRQEALRTRFDLTGLRTGGAGWQLVDDEPRVDFAVVPPAAGPLSDVVATPFDLAAGPLFRMRLMSYSAHEHRLVCDFHHLIFDGWSVGVFLTDLSRAYADLAAGGSGELAPPPLGYGAYVERQAAALPTVVARQLPYWRTQLADVPTGSPLPLDRPRPAVQSCRGAEVERSLPGALREPLEAFAGRERVTLFMVLLAVFTAQLGAYRGGDKADSADIVVGCPIGARADAAARHLIGYFINMTVLRTRVPLDATVREVLGSVRQAVFDALDHQDVPFDMVVSDLRPARGLDRNPLFQVLFSVDEDLAEPVTLGAARVGEVTGLPTFAAKFDLTFTVRLTGGALALNLEYATDLLDQDTVEAIAHDYERLLSAVLAEPATRVRELPVTVSRIDHSMPPAVTSPAPYVPPTSDQERRLVEIWTDVLDVAGLGVEDDFFRLGGDSLAASRVVAQVAAEFGVDISVRELFTAPTVAGLAAQLPDLGPRDLPLRLTPRPRLKLSELTPPDTRAEINL